MLPTGPGEIVEDVADRIVAGLRQDVVGDYGRKRGPTIYQCRTAENDVVGLGERIKGVADVELLLCVEETEVDLVD